jgi:hypothetical protein
MGMKKNFFKFLLLGAFTLSLGAGFVGCKDYDDDLTAVDGKIVELQKQLADAKTALNNKDTELNKAIADAKTATEAAVATAKAEAVAEAKKQVESMLANAPGAAEIAELNARLDAIDLSKYALKADLDAATVQIEAHKAQLALQKGVLDAYEKAVKDNGFADMDAALAAIKTAQDAIADLQDAVGTVPGGSGTELTEAQKEALAFITAEKAKLEALIDAVAPELNVLTALSSLKSLAYIPEWYDNGNPAILFYYINGIDDGKFAFSSTAKMTFRVNPTTADYKNEEIEWSFLNRLMLETRAAGDKDDLVSIKKTTFNDDGTVTFNVYGYHGNSKANDLDGHDFDYPVDGNFDSIARYEVDYIALKAIAPDEDDNDQEIVSDYIKTWFRPALAFIGDTVKMVAGIPSTITEGTTLPDYDYATDLVDMKTWDVLDSISFFLPYVDNAGKAATYDLNDYVFATINDTLVADTERLLLEDEAPGQYYYNFYAVSYTPDEDGADPTNQAFFVLPQAKYDALSNINLNPAKPWLAASLLPDGKFTVQHKTAAINRTPIFRADLVARDGDRVIARHYIKVQIVDKAAQPIDVAAIPVGEIPYLDLYSTHPAAYGTPGVSDWTDYDNTERYNLPADPGDDGVFYRPDYAEKAILSWQKMNTDVYAELGMTHAEFKEAYNVPTLITDHAAGPGKLLADKGLIDASEWLAAAGPNTGTVPVQVWIHPETRFGAHEWTIQFVPKNPAKYPTIEIPVTFNLVKPIKPAFDPNYVTNMTAGVYSGNELSVTKGKMMSDGTDTTYHMQATLEESFLMEQFIRNVVDSIVAIPNNPMVDLEGTDYEIHGYQTHLFSFGFNNAGWVAKYTADANNESKQDGLLEGEIDAVETPTWAQTNNVYNFLGQDIKLNEKIYDPEWLFNVKFRSTYENMEDIDIDWKFKFINPITVTLKPIELTTELLPDVKRLENYLTVEMLGMSIYKAPANPIGAGVVNTGNASNIALFGFPAIEEMPWKIVYTDLNEGDGTAGVKALYLSGEDDNEYVQSTDYYGSVNAAPYHSIYWSNAGTSLVTDKKSEKISVTVETSYAIATREAEIVLKKTVIIPNDQP